MYTITRAPVEKYYPDENAPRAVVLHVDLGTRERTLNHLRTSASASYHYYIPRKPDDEILELVKPNHGAWHAGRVNNPTPRAQEVFGDEDPNRCSIGICYEGRPVDKNGRVTFDWDRVVDGEKATESQVRRAAWLINYHWPNLPFFAHREITDYKPKVVKDFRMRVENILEGKTPAEEPCTLERFATRQLISEVVKRLST